MKAWVEWFGDKSDENNFYSTADLDAWLVDKSKDLALDGEPLWSLHYIDENGEEKTYLSSSEHECDF